MTNTTTEEPRVNKPTVFDYRRANLRKFITDSGGPTNFCRRMGIPNVSTIVQMTGPSPIREISEKAVRAIEQHLDLVPGCMDAPVDVPEEDLVISANIRKRQKMQRIKQQANIMGVEPVYGELNAVPYKYPPRQPQVFGLGDEPPRSDGMVSVNALGEMLMLIGRVAAAEKVELPAQKMSDIIALTLINGGKSLEEQAEFLKKLVKLTK